MVIFHRNMDLPIENGDFPSETPAGIPKMAKLISTPPSSPMVQTMKFAMKIAMN